MAGQIINELEKAAQIILAPSNYISNEQRQAAEEIFLAFRKTQSPYQLCQQILETNTNDYILFETVGLIKIALLREWTALSRQDVSSLRQYLYHYVINRPYLARYVKSCILEVIAVVVKRSTVDDSGQEMQHILGEMENLIETGDLPRKILGCDLIFAIMQEYTNLLKSSDIGLPLGTHLKEKEKFQAHLIRIFKFSVNVLDALMKKDKDIEEDTVTFLKHLLPILESIFTWEYVRSDLPHIETVFSIEVYAEAYLRLDKDWQDVMLLPSVLDLFFTLYWKIRGNLQLAHHARTCIILLASLHGPILSTEEMKLQYVSNYLQQFLKFITSINIIDQEASGIATIVKHLFIFHHEIFESLPEDVLKLFLDQLSQMTCMFIENTLKEDSSCTDCLYTEALNILFEAWIHIISDRKNPFPPEFCKQISVPIFDMYLQCHLFAPEGKRSIEEKDLDREEITVEEDDKMKYKEQLQTIGNFGRQVPNHSLPLLARLIEDRTSRLRENLNKIAGQVESFDSMSSEMNRLYEDIHWLLLVTGHVLCFESDGEVTSIPSEIMEYSIERVFQGKVNIDLTLQVLASAEDISSNMNVPIESVDHIVLLATDVFRLCTIEKTAKSVRLDSILSPELSCTITWFLRRWSLNYLFMKNDYSKTSVTFKQSFGEDTPGALWVTKLLLAKIVYNINVFKSEPVLMKETVQLLLTLVQSAEKIECKSERFRSIINLITERRYDLPQIVKRGLMQAIVRVGIAVQFEEPNYWLHTLQPLQDRCKQIISNEKFFQSYHQEEIRVEIMDILECFIGAIQGIEYSPFGWTFSHEFDILQQLPNLLSLYHNYQEIVILILEMLSEYAKKLGLLRLDSDGYDQIHKIYASTMQSYGRSNANRLTIDPTATENEYEDILLLLELLNNMLLTLTTENRRDAHLCGLHIIIPMVTTDLLKFPILCLRYFEMIERCCELLPKVVLTLEPESLQPLLGSVELGLCSFGCEVTSLCSTIIKHLTKHTMNVSSGSHGQPPNQLMAPFLNRILTLILSHQINANSVTDLQTPFYYLMCCYQERYQQLVQTILSSQSDSEIAQKLANAFTKLTHGINFDIDSKNRGRRARHFRDNESKFSKQFNEFVNNVWGFLMIK